MIYFINILDGTYQEMVEFFNPSPKEIKGDYFYPPPIPRISYVDNKNILINFHHISFKEAYDCVKKGDAVQTIKNFGKKGFRLVHTNVGPDNYYLNVYPDDNPDDSSFDGVDVIVHENAIIPKKSKRAILVKDYYK